MESAPPVTPDPPPQARATVWSGRHRGRSLWLDRLPLYVGLLWLAAGFLLTGSDSGLLLFFVLIELLLMPLLVGGWMILRVGPLLGWLAAPELRQEIALTMLAPGDFIRTRLKRRLHNLLIPFMVLAPICLFTGLLSFNGLPSNQGTPAFAIVAIFFEYWLAAALISLLAVVDTLLRLCRRPGTSGHRFAIQFLWLLFLLSGPCVQFPASVILVSNLFRTFLVRAVAVFLLWGAGALWIARSSDDFFDPDGTGVYAPRWVDRRIPMALLRPGFFLAFGLLTLPLCKAFLSTDPGDYPFYTDPFLWSVSAFWVFYPLGVFILIVRRIKALLAEYFVFEREPKRPRRAIPSPKLEKEPQA